MNIFDLLSYPFIQRAIIGGLLVGVLTSWVGILAVLKRSSMVGDTVAHASLAGVAIGLLIDVNPVLTAAGFAIIISLLLPSLKKHSKLPIDSLLGFILPFSMAIGVILLSFLPGYQPELISFLFGSILSITWADVTIISVLVLVTTVVMMVVNQRLLFVSFDEDYARTTGINVALMNGMYSVILALTIVVGIQLVGIVLLNALLVIPASTVRMFSRSLKDMFVYTPIVSMIVITTGIVLSFILDIPSGPVIAIISGSVFLLAIFLRKMIGGR